MVVVLMVNDICFKNRQHISLTSEYRHKKEMLNSFYSKNPPPIQKKENFNSLKCVQSA